MTTANSNPDATANATRATVATTNRKLALITGGTSGIGHGIAKRLGPEWDLALVYAFDDEKAKAAVDQLDKIDQVDKSTQFTKSNPPESESHFADQPNNLDRQRAVRAYKLTLSAETDFASLITRVTEDFGRAPGAMIHSAGRLSDELMLRADLTKVKQVLDEHLFVAMALSQAALKAMYRERFGRILLMSSISASYAKRGQAAYAAAKAGLEGFTRTLALEVAHRGVTVNAIAPGLIETPMTKNITAKLDESAGGLSKRIPVGRVGHPEEVGALAAFLCSEDASYITGTTITIDGGRSLGDPFS